LQILWPDQGWTFCAQSSVEALQSFLGCHNQFKIPQVFAMIAFARMIVLSR